MLLLTTAFVALPLTSRADAPKVFEHLKSLAGDWDADLPGFEKLKSAVQLVSNGKAIEETIGTPKDNELCVYTVGGDRIVMTHYCGMTPDGHQVRLQTAGLDKAPDQLDFGFAESTNLHTEAAPHMRRVLMTISDPDHYFERWTKTENGKETVFNLNFVRRQ
jgi:hypothetical protein